MSWSSRESSSSTPSPSRWKRWFKKSLEPNDSSSSLTDISSATPNGTFQDFSDSVSIETMDSSITSTCSSIRKLIMFRTFQSWLTHTRNIRTVRKTLVHLVHYPIPSKDGETEKDMDSDYPDADKGLTERIWKSLQDPKDGSIDPKNGPFVYHLLYHGGCQSTIRKEVWPYLLKHYTFGMTKEERQQKDDDIRTHYELTMTEWLALEAIVKQRDKEITAANLAKFSSESTASSDAYHESTSTVKQMSNDVFSESLTDSDSRCNSRSEARTKGIKMFRQRAVQSRGSQVIEEGPSHGLSVSLPKEDVQEVLEESNESDEAQNGLNDSTESSEPKSDATAEESTIKETGNASTTDMKSYTHHNDQSDLSSSSSSSTSTSSLPSPSSSDGVGYSLELMDNFSLNLHQIEKDVRRCDRNYPYYMDHHNLDKLRNVMCTYVWENLDHGYFQGMCDLVAPLLVIFDDESLTYSCFIDLMKRMMSNFPSGGTMSLLFVNLRSLVQVLDQEVFQLMVANGDYTHFYFCYRWFLLDFKRELVYDDVFLTWETIWSAKFVSTDKFELFIAASLIESYRDVILTNNMDFPDIIKFFNGMAERHDAQSILTLARKLVSQVQELIAENVTEDPQKTVDPPPTDQSVT